MLEKTNGSFMSRSSTFNQTILNFIENPCLLIDEKVHILGWNKAASYYFFSSIDEVLNQSLFSLNLEPKLPFTKMQLLAALTQEPRKDPLIFENDHVRSELISTDITNHTMIMLKSKNKITSDDKSELLQNIIDNLPEFVFWKNKNLEYQGANKNVINALGLDHVSSLQGKKDNDLGWDEDRVKELNRIDLSVMHDDKLITTTEKAPFKDNITRVFKTSKIPLKDHSNNIVGIIGISTDISQEKTNQENQALLINRLIENLPEYVYWKNTKLEYQGCNIHAARVLGLKYPEDVIGKTDHDFSWNIERIDELNKIDCAILQGQQQITTTEEVPLKEIDEVKILKTSKIPLKNSSGEVIGVLGISTDITEQKIIEKKLAEAKEFAERTARTKSEFIANVTHDIQTPMHGVASIITMLMRMPYNEQQAPFITKLNQAIKRLSKLISEVLDFSKFEKNEFNIQYNPTNLVEVIQENFIFIEPLTNKQGVRLELDYPQSVPRHIITDAHLLGRILGNLLANATKFTHQGSIKVKASCLNETEKTADIQLSISDTGIGIKNDKLDFIFEPFARVGLSDSSQYKGTGLGLAITKKLVEALGGSIKVQSKINQGSTFICQFNFQKQTSKKFSQKA